VTDTWRCESLRLTAFWPDGRDASNLLRWESVVGSPPDHSDSQPKARASRQVGTLPNAPATLDFRATVGRVDWFLTSSVPVTVGDLKDPFEGLLSLVDALELFSNLLFTKAGQAYDAARLAVGVNALRPADSVKASYEDLARLLPDVRVPTIDASEFFFQINRPRNSAALKNFSINRLSKWMSIVAGQLVIAIPTVAPIRLFGDAPYATRVELDISTPADFTDVIPQEAREPLLIEMRSFAEEILEKGDIA
jgi:hypothetical protein